MSTRSETEVRRWLVGRIGELVRLETASVDVRRPLQDFGLRSVDAVTLSGELSAFVNRPIAADVVYRFPTIAALAESIAHGEDLVEHAGLDESQPSGRDSQDNFVAVVGLGCRFPGGAHGPDRYWDLLSGGRDGISALPPGRWDGYSGMSSDAASLLERTVSRGGFLDDIAGFDASFFGISPREAIVMDPQQRLALEVTWEALEHAAIAPDCLHGTDTGVFVGACPAEYGVLDPSSIDVYSSTGGAMSVIANRLSYLLGAHGPSMVVDTACSASLVAVHLACQALRSGECSLAVAGGVSLLLSPAVSVNFELAGVLSPDGRSKTFDAYADGYGRGEGVGMVVLKRLSDAVADGDRVLAIIRGGTVNQDGQSNGLMAPNPRAQEALLTNAYRRAGVSPASVDYIEAHGTGTVIGDQIESNALSTVLSPDRPNDRPCLIGSAKSNLGHLEAAAGVAGLIKVVLALHHGEIPPSLHCETPEGTLAQSDSPVQVATELTPWLSDAGARLAGVSSFGFGGTNAHLVLEEAPPTVEIPSFAELSAEQRVFLFGAGSHEGLVNEVRQFIRWLDRDGVHAELDDIGYTLALCRSQGIARMGVVASNGRQLRERLDGFLANNLVPGVVESSVHGATAPVWVFSGQGSQWPAMGAQLMHAEPAFAETIEKLEAVINEEAGFSLHEALISEDPNVIASIEVIQPVIYAMGVALAAVWHSYGVYPGAVIGHSMGEVTAAVVAGRLGIEDGARVICRRSSLLTRVTGVGRMAQVLLNATQVETDIRAAGLAESVAVAVLAGKSTTVISGASADVEHMVRCYEERGITTHLVEVDIASHSPQMDPVLEPIKSALSDISESMVTVAECGVQMYSTVNRDPRASIDFSGDYWASNLREPVRFSDAVEAAAADGFTIFAELSPHPLLCHPMRNILGTGGGKRVLSMMRHDSTPSETLLSAIAEVHCHGVSVDWQHLYPKARAVSLPPRAWAHEQYWLEDEPSAAPATEPAAAGDTTDVNLATHDDLPEDVAPPVREGDPTLGTHLTLADAEGAHVWRQYFDRHSPAWLTGHVAGQHRIASVAAFAAMSGAAARVAGHAAPQIRDLVVHNPLDVSEAPGELQTILRADADNGCNSAMVRIYGKTTDSTSWTLHASARVHDQHHADIAARSLASTELTRHYTGTEFYKALAAGGLSYAPELCVIDQLQKGDSTATAMLVDNGIWADGDRGLWYPALLESCMQAVAAAAYEHPSNAEYVITGIDRVTLLSDHDAAVTTVDANTSVSRDGFVATALLRDGGGRVLGMLDRIQARRVPAPTDPVCVSAGTQAATEGGNALPETYRLEWFPKSPSGGPQLLTGQWLIIADSSGVAGRTAKLLVDQAQQCRVLQADKLVGLDADELLMALEPLDATEHIVHCGALDVPAEDAMSANSAYGLTQDILNLVRALASSQAEAKLHLVTRGGVSVADSTRNDEISISPAQATVWGLGRCLALEHPELWGGLIDLGSNDDAAAATAMLTEFRTVDDERQVAYRGGVRFCARLVPTDIGTKLERGFDARGGSQLVVGAGGRLGPSLLRRLAAHGARHVVTATRRGLGADGKAVAAELAERGVTVVDLVADVADVRVVDELGRRFGPDFPPLDGIYQLAFAESAAPMTDLTAQNLDSMFAAKVFGTCALHQLAADHHVAEFCCYSSTTGILGSHSLAHYAAASCYVDALAHARMQSGLPARVIDWGPWETGLSDTSVIESITASGLRPMRTGQVEDMLGKLLGADEQQLVVAAADWDKLTEMFATRGPFTLTDKLVARDSALSFQAGPGIQLGAGIAREFSEEGNGAATDRMGLPDTDDGTILAHLRGRCHRGGDLEELLVEHVRAVIAHVLGARSADAIDVDQDLFQVGMDSLTSVLALRKLKADLECELSPRLILNGRTVSAIAGRLASEYLAEVVFADTADGVWR